MTKYLSLLLIFILNFCGSKYEKTENIAIKVEPLSVAFGTVAVGFSDEKFVTITHVGSEGKLLLNIYLSESSSKDFSIEKPEKTTLLPQESIKIKVIYKPQEAGKDSGDLIIKHNVPPDYQTTIPITALAQKANITVIPEPIDFEGVSTDDKKVLDVRIINSGGEKVIIEKIFIKFGSSEDFSIEKINPLIPVEILPFQEILVSMKYTPYGGGVDKGTLIIEGNSADGEDVLKEAEITGYELGPHIIVAPGEIDFGWVKINGTGKVEVDVQNTGSSPLIVEDVKLELTPKGDFGVYLEKKIEKLTLQPKDHQKINILWNPQKVFDPSIQPIALLRIKSNDKYNPELLLTVNGRVDAPYIEIVPSNVVDFGYVAMGITSERELTILNKGHSSLIVKAIKYVEPISDEFSIKIDNSFLPVSEKPDEGSIPPDGKAIIVLTFTNKKAPSGEETGKIRIESNSPDKEVVEVKVVAKRAGAPTCNPEITPQSLNFGVVNQGEEKTMSMFFHNKGTGYCSLLNCKIYNCFSFVPFVKVCSGSSISKNFQLLSYPPTYKDGISPGSIHKMDVKFAPEAKKGMELSKYTFGSLVCEIYDSYSNKNILVPAKIEDPFMGSGYQVNLYGEIGYPKIVVIPKMVNFGTNSVGCASKKFEIKIHNAGNGVLKVNDINFVNCSPEFKLTNFPPFPAVVLSLQSITLGVSYIPQDVGQDSCYLEIKSNDLNEPVVYVPLKGKGILEKEYEDIFHQISGKEYDMLIVLDDCACVVQAWGSQIMEQIDDFVSKGAVWSADFHIGVVIMNIENKNVAGKLNEGNPEIQPRFVTMNTPDYKNKFRENFKEILYNTVSADYNLRAGLHASYIALTEPLTTDTNVSCNKDEVCLNDINVCPNPKDCPYQCVDGKCGGYNREFYRDTAALDIVYITKWEDESPAALQVYIDSLKSIKGYNNINLFHAHSVTWKEICGGEFAMASKRYPEVAKATGGNTDYICNDFAWILNEIGKGTQALKVQFFLSASPEPSTIKVYVKGKGCEKGWKYDEASNSIIFELNSQCMPQLGDEIKVKYSVLCK